MSKISNGGNGSEDPAPSKLSINAEGTSSNKIMRDAYSWGYALKESMDTAY